MASVPANCRWRIDDSGAEFIITIPQKFDWFAFSLPLLIVPFAFVISAEGQESALLGLAALFMFIFLIKPWLWNLGGVEVITISNNEVAIRYNLYGVFWTRRTPLANVEGFTWEKKSSGRHGHPPGIALVRKNHTFWFVSEIRFADYIARAEADELIGMIQYRFPNLPNLHYKGAGWQ